MTKSTIKEFTIGQAAKLLKRHPDTLRRWEWQKKLVPIRRDEAGCRVYSQEQIDELKRRARP